MRTIAIPSVLRPGNCTSVAGVKLTPKELLVLPSLASPSKKKSPETTAEAALQLGESPAGEVGMQKSCRGLGSEIHGVGNCTSVNRRQRRSKKGDITFNGLSMVLDVLVVC